MKKAIISAKDLCKSFAHNGGQVHIIQNVDLDIYEVDFTVIMGSSGSGKSTLLYALSGMDQATSGRVEIAGMNITEMSFIMCPSLCILCAERPHTIHYIITHKI